MTGLPLLYRDDFLVAVNKPSGLLVHRSPIDRSETVFALQLLRDQLGRRVYPLHRLDKATSGVLLFALDPATARTVTGSFAGGRMAKSYLAVVRGFASEDGRIDHPLREPRDRMARPPESGDGTARDAVTDFRCLARTELPVPAGRYATTRCSLMRAAPRTGRTHQVRRHLKHIFHPVIGDTTYGDGRVNGVFREHFGCRRLLLHAEELVFAHPASGLPVSIRAPLDPVFASLVEQFGWHEALATGPQGTVA